MARHTRSRFFSCTAAVFVSTLTLFSCSTSGTRENTHAIRQLILKTVHFRRPAGPGADPRVGPGGEDFTGQPLPDQRFDCRPIAELHRELDLKAIHSCLASVTQNLSVRYRLRRMPEPFLELQQEKLVPPCIEKTLARIPLPRELVFQSKDSGSFECYSSRLEIEADDVPALGVKWPLSRTQLTLAFPISELPEEEDRLGLLIDAWAMSVFLSPQKRSLRAYLMPQAICERCMGEKTLVRPGDPPQALWPDYGENPEEIE